MTASPPSDDPRAYRLRRMKALASGFLVAALVLLALAHVHHRQGAWAWIGAAAEAATVGALADWFAVVALFRHPLGLPFPHTAIIPRNKARIADALARFVVENFLERGHLLGRLRAWNPARRLGEFLSTPERLDALARQLQAWVSRSLAALDSPAFERELMDIVRRQLLGWNAAATASQLMQVLTRGQHHQRVLNAGLSQVASWIDQPGVRAFITGKVVSLARREYPKLVWFTDKLHYTEELGDALATRMANALVDEVRAVLDDPAHPLRERYSAEANRLMEALAHEPEMQARVAEFKQRLLDSPDVQAYVHGLWQRVREWLHADLAGSDSVTMARFRDYAARLGLRLRDDSVWQATANEQLQIAAEHLADQLRDVAPRYIRQTVESWDTGFLVQQIEHSVGRDLQFIRLNGTVVGGVAGLALHAVFQLPWFQ